MGTPVVGNGNQLIIGEKDWKYISVPKMATYISVCNVAMECNNWLFSEPSILLRNNITLIR